MNIIVCVKQVPDVAELKFDDQRKVLIREGVKNVLNPFDRRAIAEAIRLLADDEGLRRRLAEGGRSFAGRFSWDEVARQTLALYERVMG